MTEIDLPFSDEMAVAVDEGRKECTSRNSKKGVPGDTFVVKDRHYKITRVISMPLVRVALGLYKEEGFATSDAFKDYYDSLYKKRGGNGYVSNKVVWVHFFVRMVAWTG
jgi:hypothetical protein